MSDELRDSTASAIEAAIHSVNETETELHVPSEYVMDVLLNVCAGIEPGLLRPDFRKWVRSQIDRLPNLTAQERERIRAMGFQCPNQP